MKWLFVLLLALNVGFFAWQMNRERSAVSLPAVEPALEGERLLLLREVREPPTADDGGALSSTPPGSAVPPAARAAACFSVGPFADRAEAGRIGEWFKAAGAQTQVRVSEQRQRSALLLHLPPEPSAELAQQKVAELAALGIEDYAIAEVGGRPHTPVLGVYQDRDAAEQRVAELRAAGLDVHIAEQQGAETKFWLDLTEDSGASPSPVWDRLAREYPELERIARRCRQIAPDQVIP